MSGEKRKTLQSTLWLGTAGALLILGGISALLASNWVRVPFAAQLAVAFTPLLCGWAGFFYVARRETIPLAWSEILGIVWSGGVICSIALLGRILQLSSSAFLFCLAVAALLLPIVYVLRTTAAWLAFLGFAMAAAIEKSDSYLSQPPEILIALAILVATGALLATRLRFAWRETNLYALGQRYLAALGSCALASTLFFTCHEFLDEFSFSTRLDVFFAFLPSLPLPLLIGAFVERENTARGRPTMIFGSLLLAFVSLILIGLTDSNDTFLWQPIPLAVVTLALFLFALHRLRHLREALFLLLVPLVALAYTYGLPLLCLMLAIGVGTVVITAGVRTGERMLANEGLIFVIASAFTLFIKTDMALTLQGFFLILSGLALVALNVVLTRLETKGVSHDA